MEHLIRALDVDHLARALGGDYTTLALVVAGVLFGFIVGMYIGLEK